MSRFILGGAYSTCQSPFQYFSNSASARNTLALRKRETSCEQPNDLHQLYWIDFVDRGEEEADVEIRKTAHRTLAKVTGDIERFAFNTAVSALMEFNNALMAYVREGARRATFTEVYDLLLLMLAPMAPHVAHELWQRTGHDTMLAAEPWPAFDPALVVEDVVTMVIQVNGKVRDRVEVPAGIEEDEAVELAVGRDKIRRWTEGKQIRKVVARPPKLVNIVVG